MMVNENTFTTMEASRTANEWLEELTAPDAPPYRSCSCSCEHPS
jgi:hypothetical protein